MSSNEHPDMSGNPADAPFICDQCGREYREEACYGVSGNDQVFFCSGECAMDWEENQIESWYDLGL